MFDLSLKTLLGYAILIVPSTFCLMLVLWLIIAILENTPNEMQDCCEQVGMEFVLYSTYNCLDYQNHKILTVVQQNNQCFYGE